MTRKVFLYILATTIVHGAIAIGTFGAMRVAERSGLPAFRWLDRALMFADVPKYFEHANNAAAGLVPYRDDPIEYPPLALPFLFAPRLIARSQALFVAVFAAEMLLFDALLVALVAWRVRTTVGIERVPGRLAWLTLFFATISPFVLGRYDAVPAFLGFAAACAWFSGRSAAGGGLAAIGTLVKIAPGAVALPGIVGEVMGWNRPRGRGTASFFAVLLAGVGAWFAIGGSGVMESIRYHSDRQIEIGSVPAGLLWIAGRAQGATMEVFEGHQSLNLMAPGSYETARLALILQAGAMLFVVLGYLRDRGRDPFRFAGAAVVAFAVGGKVLSPQYLIWIMPFVAAQGGGAGRAARPVFLVAGVLTMVLYPWAFGALPRLETWAFVVLNARNLALLLVLAILVLVPGEDAASPARTDPPRRA